MSPGPGARAVGTKPGRSPLPRLKAKSKVWVEVDGKPVFGDGKARLLELVGKTGSLRAAASQMGMSYRAAWGKIEEMERRLGCELVVRRAGGKGGGRPELTALARTLLARYRSFRAGIDAAVDRRFRKAFR